MSRFHKIKKAAKDFDPSMLPQTRRAVFFDVMKLQWRKLLLLSLILLAAALPLLLIAVYEDTYLLTVSEDPAIDPASIPALIAPLHIFCAVLSAPCGVLFFLALSGVIRVVRQLAWEENAMVFPDFLKGLKQNWKQFLPLGILFSLGYAFAKIGWHSALATQSQSVWGQGVCLGLLVFFIAPLVCYGMVVVAVYSNTLGSHLRLAAYLYLKNPLKTLGAMFAAFGLSAAVWVIPQLQVHLIGSLPAMMAFVLGLLGWTLFAFDRLDQHYNTQQHPELLGKGVNGK